VFRPDTVILAETPSVRAGGAGLRSPVTRFVDAQTRIPLIRFDCQGQPRPALATGWRGDPAGTIWTFQLAGELVEPGALLAQWRARAAETEWPWSQIAEATATGLGLVVRLRAGAATLPAEFGDPVLGAEVVTLGGAVEIIAVDGDERNVLDPGSSRGVDLLFSRDPATTEYASDRPEWVVVALPWDRRYHLLTPLALRVPLAGGAAWAEAVPAGGGVPAGPAWWALRPDCDRRPEPLPPAHPRPEVAYLAGDPVAKSLAERLVALGIPEVSGAGRLRTVALDSAALASALGLGLVAAAVAADPAEVPLGCRPTPWSTLARFRYPLIETRAYLIARRDLGPLTVDRDGTVRLPPPPRS
jgi:hypothetical protein